MRAVSGRMEIDMGKSNDLGLCVDRKNRLVYYRGYQLKLTKKEYYICAAMCKSKGCMNATELIAAMGSSEKIGNGNIAVHVHNINKKAMKIDGNKPIRFERNEWAYYIAD